MIANSEWYKEDRGYKANIVTYTLAWLTNAVQNSGRVIDFEAVWGKQDLHTDMKQCIEEIAPRVAAVIKEPPPEIKNVTEYAKRQMCWSRVKSLDIPLPSDLSEFSVSETENREQQKEAFKERRVDEGIEFETRLIQLADRVSVIREAAGARDLLSPAGASGLQKLEAGKLNFTMKEKEALQFILARLDQEDVKL